MLGIQGKYGSARSLLPRHEGTLPPPLACAAVAVRSCVQSPEVRPLRGGGGQRARAANLSRIEGSNVRSTAVGIAPLRIAREHGPPRDHRVGSHRGLVDAALRRLRHGSVTGAQPGRASCGPPVVRAGPRG